MKQLLRSFGHAFRGLCRGLRLGQNMALHCLAVVVVTACGLLAGFAAWQWVAAVLWFMVVIALELVNTALERLCDKVHPERHAVIRDVKDMAAGAVLWAALGSTVIFVILLVTAL